MDIKQLDREFQRGTYKHYTLSEYQFLRRFCELTQPTTITVVGGHTNMDLFYATQDCSPRVTNWDPGNSTESSTRAEQNRLQEITKFRGEYQWIAQSVADLTAVDMKADLVWLNVIPSDMTRIAQWPESLVFTHDGDLTKVSLIMQIHKHTPLVALGRMVAVFSRQEHNWSHTTYRLRENGRMGPINPVHEIMR